MRMPGFGADASLRPVTVMYRGNAATGGSTPRGGDEVAPQFMARAASDPDIGAYLRCRANGGHELICRFFGGLPPFTIGGLLF